MPCYMVATKHLHYTCEAMISSLSTDISSVASIHEHVNDMIMYKALLNDIQYHHHLRPSPRRTISPVNRRTLMKWSQQRFLTYQSRKIERLAKKHLIDSLAECHHKRCKSSSSTSRFDFDQSKLSYRLRCYGNVQVVLRPAQLSRLGIDMDYSRPGSGRV